MKKCTTCNGTEECRWCNGTGREYTDPGESYPSKCTDCDGTGVCKDCDSMPVICESNCCSEEIEEHLVNYDFDGGTARCPSCKEICHISKERS